MRRRLIIPLLTAGVGAAILAGVAAASSATLQIAHHGKVTNQTGTTVHEPIVVNARGFAVYTLSGETIHHPLCTAANHCFSVWPPVTVASTRDLRPMSGIHGKLGSWRRDGFVQVTLGGHPLYTYAPDTHKDWATGEGITSFGGTWHVVKPSAGTRRTSSTTTNSTTMTMAASTTTTTTSSTAACTGYYC